MPTSIPDAPPWVVETLKLMAPGLLGWWVGRRGTAATASKDEAEAADKLVNIAMKLAADANARSERVALENEVLHAKVDRVLLPLVDFVTEWDRDCRHCETRPALPQALAERIAKIAAVDPH